MDMGDSSRRENIPPVRTKELARRTKVTMSPKSDEGTKPLSQQYQFKKQEVEQALVQTHIFFFFFFFLIKKLIASLVIWQKNGNGNIEGAEGMVKPTCASETLRNPKIIEALNEDILLEEFWTKQTDEGPWSEV